MLSFNNDKEIVGIFSTNVIQARAPCFHWHLQRYLHAYFTLSRQYLENWPTMIGIQSIKYLVDKQKFLLSILFIILLSR